MTVVDCGFVGSRDETKIMIEVAMLVMPMKYPTRYRLPPRKSVNVAQKRVDTMPTAGTPVG